MEEGRLQLVVARTRGTRTRHGTARHGPLLRNTALRSNRCVLAACGAGLVANGGYRVGADGREVGGSVFFFVDFADQDAAAPGRNGE